eukprot:g5479.t1
MSQKYTRNTGCPTHNFAVVICRNAQGKYLSVDECRNRGWWVPAGWVDPGESLQMAAVRETKEEAGIDIVLKGVLRVEHSHSPYGARLRAIFYAEPKDEKQSPKSVPDEESNGAAFLSVEEFLAKKKKRGGELVDWGRYLDQGGPIFPLQVLTGEADPVTMPAQANINTFSKAKRKADDS